MEAGSKSVFMQKTIRLGSYIDNQNVGRAVNDMQILDSGIQNYKMNNDIYPLRITGNCMTAPRFTAWACMSDFSCCTRASRLSPRRFRLAKQLLCDR